jgi:hypothetical protein
MRTLPKGLRADTDGVLLHGLKNISSFFAQSVPFSPGL